MNTQPASDSLSGTSRRSFLREAAGSTLAGALLPASSATRAFARAPDGAKPGQLFAGTAKADISPDEGKGVDIVGKKLAGKDRLFARALVLREGGVSLAIVSLDLILFASKKVVAEAKKQWGIDHVILSSTHTHAAPCPRGLILDPSKKDWLGVGYDSGEFLDWDGLSADSWYAATEEKIIAAIGKAAKNQFAATLTAGSGPFASGYMAHNRRLVREDGTVVMMWANPKRIPTAPVDPTVGVIRIEDGAGKPRALLVHYACHPVATMASGVLSRDYPGATVDAIEKELGADCLAMFLQGASGDLDPYDMDLVGQHENDVMNQSGISLAKGALKLAAGLPRAAAQSSLRVQEDTLTIPNRDGDKKTKVTLSQVVINGNLALVAIPGESFIQHQLDLRKLSPVAHSFMLGLTYCGSGSPFVIYIPTEKAAKEGGYGAKEYTFLHPSAGAKMVQHAAATYKELVKRG